MDIERDLICNEKEKNGKPIDTIPIGYNLSIQKCCD